MTGTILNEKFFSEFDLPTAGHFTGTHGISRELVVAVINDRDNMNDGVAQAQLANLRLRSLRENRH